jgi:hypothetical protein
MLPMKYQRHFSGIVAIILLGLLLAACNFSFEEATPTVDGIIEEPIDPLPEIAEVSPSPSPTATPTSQDEIQIATPTPFFTDVPTETPIPTETLGPWEYEIRAGDTLGYIIQQPPFNYRNRAVIDEIVRINPNIPNPDTLPGPGAVILIPRPTETPIPEGLELTAAIDAAQGVLTRGNVRLPANAEIGLHVVRQNETAIGIVEQYGGMTLEIFSQLNAEVNFLGCNFEEPGGGPSCAPNLREGQQVNVVLPTPTPTLSPTPSGSETPTPTPTYRPPSLISPFSGGIAPPGVVTLQWVSVGSLKVDEVYLVQVRDTTNDTVWHDTTRLTSIRLPNWMIPDDGQQHSMEWSITVARPNDQGVYAPVGAWSETRTFQWQSR